MGKRRKEKGKSLYTIDFYLLLFPFSCIDGGATLSFRARIDTNPETLAEFEQAWEQRYAEGLRLIEVESTRTGGVYLLGYVAEMILKVAYFRFIGAASDSLVKNLLAEPIFINATNNLGMDSEAKHSILFWTELLIVTRGQRTRRLPRHLADELRISASTLHFNWKVDIRYHSLLVTVPEQLEVKEAVDWFRKHHKSLWR